MALSHLAVFLCSHNLSTGMFILHWLHRRSGIGTSCRIEISYFQCLYMKLSLSIPGLYAPSWHPSTENSTGVNMRWEETTYVSAPPSDNFHSLGMKHYSPMKSLHVVVEQLCYHSHTAILATYPIFLPLPELFPLRRLRPLMRRLFLMPPD